MRGRPVLDTIRSDVRYALRWLRGVPALRSWPSPRSRSASASTPRSSRSSTRSCSGRCPSIAPTASSTSTRSGSDGDQYATSSYPDLLDFRAQNQVFSDMLAYSPSLAAVKLTDRSRLAMGETVTGNYFQLLGVRAAAGRTLLPDDDRPGAPRAVVISYRLWNREYARQSVGRRPVDSDPRPGVHDRRRRAEAVHRHGAAARAGSVDADGLRRRGGARRHHQHGPVADRQHAARAPRHALDVRQGPSEDGRDVRSGRGQPAPHRQAAPDRQPPDQQGPRGLDVADQGRAHSSDGRSHAAADRVRADVRRRTRPADCVRERGEHAAGPRVRAAEGNRHQAGDRRQPPPARAAAAVGESRAGRPRRRGRRRRSRGR